MPEPIFAALLIVAALCTALIVYLRMIQRPVMQLQSPWQIYLSTLLTVVMGSYVFLASVTSPEGTLMPTFTWLMVIPLTGMIVVLLFEVRKTWHIKRSLHAE